jgi:hypothetical protein
MISPQLAISLRGEGDQRHVSRAFDGFRNHTLMFGARTRLASRTDLALFGNVAFEQIDLFVIERFGFIRAELAYSRPARETSAPARRTRAPLWLIVLVFVLILVFYQFFFFSQCPYSYTSNRIHRDENGSLY